MSTIKVAVIEPNKTARFGEIGNKLECFQRLVGGYIEVVYAYEEYGILLIVNEDGKLRGLTPNRTIVYENGNIDVLCGTIVAVGAGEDDFASLTDSQIKTIKELFDTRLKMFKI